MICEKDDDDYDFDFNDFGGQVRLDLSKGLTFFTIFSVCIVAGLHDLVAGIFNPGL